MDALSQFWADWWWAICLFVLIIAGGGISWSRKSDKS